MSRLVSSLLLALALTLAGCGGGPATPPVNLLGLTYVVFAPEGEEEIESPVALGGDSRPALSAPTPAEFRYRLEIPERAFLTFDIGIAEVPGSPAPLDLSSLPGNRMRFEVRVGDPIPHEVVFQREIHVSRRGRWLSQTVDLSRFAGREIWLVFQTAFPGHEDASPLPLVGLFADPVLHDRKAYGGSRGVVVISIDTLRRDHVSLYGYPRHTTPGLEALASDAVVFDDAVSTASWTLPAHASLLTSTYPSVHGAVDSDRGLSPQWPNLAKTLQENGFFTQAMVTHLYLSKQYGFGEGFDRHRYLPETRAEEVTNQAIHFLESRGDADFFLFLHYYDPHWHYDPPAPYDRTFDPSYDGAVTGIWWDFKELDRETIAPRDLHHLEALYDGEILYTDRHVERLFQEMKRIGVFEKALVIVTSDHGEEFLDHGSWEHQKTLYEEQLRVPLLMKLPGSETGSRRVGEQVSLVDVAPTVLDVLSIAPPPTYEGRSLLPLCREQGEASAREVWAETEHTLDGSHKFALRRGADGEKVIFTSKADGLVLERYDLEDDAKESRNLAGTAEDAELAARLETYLKDVEARRRGKGKSPDVNLSPEDVERLKSLGYVVK
jgi:arylsulfatase A-like enzyme